MNLERKYKLYRLGIEQEYKYEKVFEVFDGLLSLNRFETSIHPAKIFFMDSKGNLIMEYRSNQMKMNFHYSFYWKEYGENERNIRDFLVYLMGQTYKLRVHILDNMFSVDLKNIETYYKNSL